MSRTIRQSEFIDYKDGTKAASQKVRKHVMKDYRWRQSSSTKNHARVDKEKDFAAEDFTWVQPETIETSKPRTRSTFPAALIINADLAKSIPSRLCITPSNGGVTNFDAIVCPILHGLEAHSLDPFDSLPIKNDPDVGLMLQ